MANVESLDHQQLHRERSDRNQCEVPVSRGNLVLQPAPGHRNESPRAGDPYQGRVGIGHWPPRPGDSGHQSGHNLPPGVPGSRIEQAATYVTHYLMKRKDTFAEGGNPTFRVGNYSERGKKVGPSTVPILEHGFARSISIIGETISSHQPRLFPTECACPIWQWQHL